jgi:hypothetical protein
MKLLNLVVWILFLIILSEWTIKYVIRFGRFVKSSKDQWIWYKLMMVFNVEQKKVVWRNEDVLWASGIARCGGWNLFS